MTNLIYPCLWFDGQAKNAAEFYCSVFKNGIITAENPMVVTFSLDGQKFMCLNGGPEFVINPSVSFFVVCETESETDAIWHKLSEGGFALMPLDKYDWSEKYGWVQDRFGVSWQISQGKLSDVGQKFAPALLFVGPQHGKAEAAVEFYTRVFDNSSVTGILKYGPGEHEPDGTVKHAQFKVNGYVMMAMDNSFQHQFNFNEAVSFVVECDTQEEIDYFWDTLTQGGAESMCGWLKDKFGVSWQIIPAILKDLMTDPARSERVVQAFLQMKKFDIEKLLNA